MQPEKEAKQTDNKSELKCLSFKTKQSRRIKKYSNLLRRDYDLSSSIDNSTSVLVLCNAGLATGLSKEQLLEVVLPFGPVKNVVLIPGKSSCFVEFYNEDVALEAYKNLQGKPAPLIKQGELFLTFVEKAPEQQQKWTATLPPGLTILPDFVTKEEETRLLNCVDWKVVDPQAGQSLKHRRVRHYGYQFDYDTNNVNPDAPLSERLPEACLSVVEKLRAQQLVSWNPDQLTVNQYQPGQGIPPHIDTHSAFEDPILSLSLGADVVMEFRLQGQHKRVLLPQRSLLIMTEEARYCWSHGITPRKSDVVPSSAGGVTLQNRGVRTSFTLRRLRRAPCACAYPQFCDSQRSLVQPDLEKQAAQLELLHVHQVYEEIACHFSDTRHSPWPNVRDFVLRQPPGCVVLDVGCGNGKYLGLNSLAYQVGCDSSIQLSKVCRDRRHETFVCNCLQLPVCSARVDCCLSIAVIHHLSTQERRLQALSEMCRVLRPGGCALVYVWARDQARGQVSSSYLKQACSPPHPEPELLPASPFSLPVHTNRTQFAHPDMLVPWKLRPSKGDVALPAGESNATGTVLYRYYHVFDEGELEALCGQVSGIQVQQSYYDQGNWCVVFEKL